MRVAVIGLGYVGLTAAVCLSQAGHEVTGVEADPERLARLRELRLPFFEPGLLEGMTGALRSGRLSFAGDVREFGDPLDAAIVAVGSPQLPSGRADLSQVTAALQSLEALPLAPRLVMLKSTVPPGTSRRMLARLGPALARRYVYSPEFLSQGTAVRDWQAPARIVIGTDNKELLGEARELLRGCEAPWVVTTPTNAEMIKYAANAFLATKVSFVNEIANLCDDVGASIDDVVEGLGLDPRIGPAFLKAGVGWGGSCFPKDTRALANVAVGHRRSLPLLEAVITVNNRQPVMLLGAIHGSLQRVAEPLVAVGGLSFKAGTDDTREAPSRTMLPELIAQGYRVVAWDPLVACEVSERVFPGVTRAETFEQAAAGAHLVLVLTDAREIVGADWGAISRQMQAPKLVVDGRNCLDATFLRAVGLNYRAVGRAAS
jgi:UDPglucose 6-dehydrogenase